MTTSLKNSRELILDLLQASLTDPESRSDSTWIRGVGADYDNSFVGYPLISVGHATQDAPLKAFNNNNRMRVGGTTILVFTNNDIQLDTLCDSIITLIENNEATLNTSGLNSITVSVGEGDYVMVSGDELHSCPITVEYVY